MNKTKLIWSLGLVLMVGTELLAQNVAFKSSNFKDKKSEFKRLNGVLKAADELLEKGNELIYQVKDPGTLFYEAVLKYEELVNFSPNTAQLNFKLGNSYLYTNNKAKALLVLEKAEKLDAEVDPFLDFYLGMAYQLNENFDRALKYYKKFESSARSKRVAELGRMMSKRKKECKYGKSLIANPVRAWVDHLPTISSKADDYSPCISMDGAEMLFTSNRKNGNKPNKAKRYDADIYKSQLVDGAWSKPIRLGSPLNTPKDDIATMLWYDGTKLLMFRMDGEDYDLYESKLKGANWSNPTQLVGRVNSSENQCHASYNYRGNEIVFMSDKQLVSSGRGFDLFFSGKMNNSNKFGNEQSMGKDINSKYNEGSVYLHPDGETMYISSEGFNSMGGYDIFISKRKQGQWKEPVNMGYPINTPYDDLFFAATASGKFAYISSNRAGGKGGMDLYKVTFWGPDKQHAVDTEDYLLASRANPIKDVHIEKKVKVDKKSLTVFKGKTIDAISDKAVEAKIEIVDNSSGRKIETFTTNSASGKFLLSLVAGKNYGIAVKAEGYLFHSENFDIPKGSDFNLVNKVIKLKNIAKGSKIALRNIFFDSGKDKLKPESNSELERLVKLLNDVPQLKIEISGHTDNVGSDKANLKLSQKRAEAVVNYLLNKGIPQSRLIAKGYGARKPVASNKTADGRRNNRRTEFEIIDN